MKSMKENLLTKKTSSVQVKKKDISTNPLSLLSEVAIPQILQFSSLKPPDIKGISSIHLSVSPNELGMPACKRSLTGWARH